MRLVDEAPGSPDDERERHTAGGVTEAPILTPELLARHDRPGPRYTSYPTALQFDEAYGPTEHTANLAAASDPLSLYVHLPFCQARCSFCACHVVIAQNPHLHDAYLSALAREAETLAAILGRRRSLAQYHWGGGTPTFHPSAELRVLHQRILRHFDLVPDAEVSVEVDPRVTGPDHLETLAGLGFNRLSAGVQDLDPRVQELIGRRQTATETAQLVDTARWLGFGSINLDLVYGLPGQTEASLRRTLDTILGLTPERLAIYSFAYVPWMRPNQRRIDQTLLPGREEKLALLSLLVSRLSQAGYQQVGMDHFALPTDELAVAAREGTLTRNFMGYGTRRSRDVIALGSSGISDVDGVYAQNHRKLSSYLLAASSGHLTVERGLVPTEDDRIRRHVIIELMCHGRIDLSRVGDRFRIDPASYFCREMDELEAPGGPVEEGLAVLDGPVVQATDLGRLFIRRLAMTFDRYQGLYEGERPRLPRMV